MVCKVLINLQYLLILAVRAQDLSVQIVRLADKILGHEDLGANELDHKLLRRHALESHEPGKGEGYGYSDFLSSFQAMYNKPVFVARGYFDNALAFIGENW